AFEVLRGEEPDSDVGALASQLARFQFFQGDIEGARASVELALDMAETLALPELLARALTTKSLVVTACGHRAESIALLAHALQVAVDNDLPAAAKRAHTNLASLLWVLGDYERALAHTRACVALARKHGDRPGEVFALCNLVGDLQEVSAWDEALELGAELL